MRKFCYVLAASLIITGCGLKLSQKTIEEDILLENFEQIEIIEVVAAKPAITTVLPVDNLEIPMPSFSVANLFEQADLSPEEQKELAKLFDEFKVPMADTPRVRYYLDYFTGSGRKSMQMWIDRSNKYMYIVLDIFKREKVPLDLAVLAFTESGFNPHAYSRAGAAGMWQFMPSTGKLYQLNITDWVDERRDFEKATIAAARHLRDLYEIFDDWYLALAAYNAGSGKISRATKAHNTNDFFKIATGKTLKLETRDYVPKFLAQLLIFTHMEEYGFTPPQEQPLLFDKVTLTKQANIYVIAESIGCSAQEIKDLNPEIKTPMTPPASEYNIRIPLGSKSVAEAVINDPAADLSRYSVYHAKAGESIASIAKRFGTTQDAIKKLNNFAYNSVYTNKVFFIPKPGMKFTEVDETFIKEIAKLSPKYYVVKKGDNMTSISKKHNMPLATLKQLNPKINPSRIYPGQVLIISQGGLTG